MDFTFGYFKACQYVLAGHQHKRTLQPHVVSIQAVSLRLVVCRESAAPDAVQLTQPTAQAAVEVLCLHPVQDVDTGLSVLRGRNGYKVLPERVFRVAHQHALIAGLRLHPAKLANRNHHPAGYHRGHFNPVGFQLCPACNGTAHQVMGHKARFLFKQDAVVVTLLHHVLDLAVGCRHHQLAAHAAHLLDQQFQRHQTLPGSHFVHRQVRQSRQLVNPQLPALTGQPVHKLRTAQQFADHGSQILGIALTVHAAAGLAAGSLAEGHTLQKADGLFGCVRLALIQKLFLAAPGGKQVVVRGQRLVPASYDVRKGSAFRL